MIGLRGEGAGDGGMAVAQLLCPWHFLWGCARWGGGEGVCSGDASHLPSPALGPQASSRKEPRSDS